MIINLKTHKDGEWFPFFYSRLNMDTMEIEYDDPIEDGPRMRIRNPTPFLQKRAETRKKVSEWVLNKKTRAMEKVTNDADLTPAEKKKEDDDFIDYVIAEVEGFKIDGKEVTGTRQDKIDMMSIPMVSMYVNRCVTLLQETSAEQEKSEGKNLSTGSSSKKTKPDPE